MKQTTLTERIHDEVNKLAFWTRYKVGPQPNCLHILAFARGGSTIVAEAISSTLKAPIIWEPFDRGTKSPQLIENTPVWGWQEYIPKDFESSTIDKYFDSIQQGLWRDPKLFRKQNPLKIALSKNVVVKHCFSHNLMPYLQFKYGLRILCINRHPAQIIASRQKYGNFLHTNKSFTTDNAQSKHSSELLLTHSDIRGDYIKTSYGVTAWKYCINQLAIQQLSCKTTLHIDYDDIVTKPAFVAEKLSRWYGQKFDYKLLLKQSSTTRGKRHAQKRLNGWKSLLSKEHINEIEAICNDAFGLNIPF